MKRKHKPKEPNVDITTRFLTHIDVDYGKTLLGCIKSSFKVVSMRIEENGLLKVPKTPLDMLQCAEVSTDGYDFPHVEVYLHLSYTDAHKKQLRQEYEQKAKEYEDWVDENSEELEARAARQEELNRKAREKREAQTNAKKLAQFEKLKKELNL